MLEIKQVSVIGFGNVGYELSRSLQSVGISVSHVYARSIDCDDNFPNTMFVNSLKDLPQGELVLICVPDSEIENVLRHIPSGTPVAYTSGAVKLNELKHSGEIGVFYPLQSFTKGIVLDITQVPFFIESKSEAFGNTLFQLASKLSQNVQFANSDVRSKLHLAAIWVNNFTNHMNFIAKEYLDANELNFSDLMPLLKETIRKIESNNPEKAQTGPARRGDLNVIEKHLTMLPDKRQELYLKISNSIINTYSEND